MLQAQISQVTGRAVVVPGDDIDTDRIIPARYMKELTFDRMGEFLFRDVRRDEDGNPKAHPIDDPRHAGACILISGDNFGCGSSREHAPQALYRAGFRAIIAGSFAEIFFGNSTQLGMPCVSVAAEGRAALSAAIEANPSLEVTVDLEARQVRAGHLSLPCDIRESARSSLLNGSWDPLDELLAGADAVEQTARSQGYLS